MVTDTDEVMVVQTPEMERDWWNEHTERSEQYGGDWADTACLLEIDRIIGFGDNIQVLDLGCGTGRLLRPLAKRFPWYRFMGSDSSPSMLGGMNPYTPTRNINIHCTDGRTLVPLKDDTFDAAYSVLLFQHLPPLAVAGYLAELHRVLKPGGRLRFQFVAGDTAPAFQHWQYETWEILDCCEDCGFEVVAVDEGRVQPDWTWITAVRP